MPIIKYIMPFFNVTFIHHNLAVEDNRFPFPKFKHKIYLTTCLFLHMYKSYVYIANSQISYCIQLDITVSHLVESKILDNSVIFNEIFHS